MIIDAISLECRRQGYELLVTTCSAADLPEIMRAVHAEQCGGVLLLGTELTDGDLRTLPQLPVPLVLLDNASAETDVNSITMDNRNAIRQALRYLHELGHKKIGFLANQTPSSNCMARERAYCEAVRENEQEPQIFRVNPTPDEAYRACMNLRGAREYAVFQRALDREHDSIALGRDQGSDVRQDSAFRKTYPSSALTHPDFRHV